MNDEIRIAISPWMQARLKAMADEKERLLKAYVEAVTAIEVREAEAITTMVAMHADPDAVGSWSLVRSESEIILTPPPDTTPDKPTDDAPLESRDDEASEPTHSDLACRPPPMLVQLTPLWRPAKRFIH
jgi:hypothetical protein